MTKITNLDRYDTLLDIQKSDTSDKKYEIRWSQAYGYFCECAGWQSSKKKTKTCKHIKRSVFKSDLLAGTQLSLQKIESIIESAKQIWKGIV